MKKIVLSLFLVLSMMLGLLTVLPMTVGAEDADIVIANVDDWLALCGTTVENKSVTVTADVLDFDGKTLTPIIFHGGVFDGNGVVIKNVKMSGVGDVALFCDSNGTFKNMVITDSSFTGTGNWLAALICCTDNTTTIENVFVSGSVSVNVTGTESSSYAALLVGGCADKSIAYTVTIKDCLTAGTVTATGKYGGQFVGSANGADGFSHTIHIKNSMALGKVSAKSPNCGFVGYSKYCDVKMENCIYAGGAENDYFTSYVFTRDVKTVTLTNCYTTHVNSDDTVAVDLKYSDANSGVTYLNKDRDLSDTTLNYRVDLIGTEAIDVEGFTKRANDIMVPNGVAAFAPAIYNSNYTVTWANEDGTVIATEEYMGGQTPEYKGETPTKADDDKYTYTFNGWSPAISAVTADTTYTATYYKTRKNIEIEDDDETTKAPETTEAPADSTATTEAPAEEDKGGCGAVAGGSVLVLSMILGSAVVLGKKKED